ncbi:MAG: HD domain-containing protein [Cytophagales bacterium]|nr:MAG: HD domain-containing protein [Cytophagales bacterium]
MNVAAACQHILNQLQAGLSPKLTYHCVAHTLDVVEQSERIARAEGIDAPETLALLQTAAYYHDAGFLQVYDDHEAVSCQIAQTTLPDFGYSPEQITDVCALIMATKIPQTPLSKLGEIICDADLDYLGRSDYKAVSETLLSEWLTYNRLPDPTRWFPIQVGFLGNHRYFTQTNQLLREPPKQQFVAAIQDQLALASQ